MCNLVCAHPPYLERTPVAGRDVIAVSPSVTAPISSARRWSIVTLLFAAALINYIDRGTISVALPLIAHDLHFGAELKGVLLSRRVLVAH